MAWRGSDGTGKQGDHASPAETRGGITAMAARQRRTTIYSTRMNIARIPNAVISPRRGIRTSSDIVRW